MMTSEAKNKPLKKISSEIIEVDKMVLPDISPNTWLSLKGIDLTEMDKIMIVFREELTNMHISFAQEEAVSPHLRTADTF